MPERAEKLTVSRLVDLIQEVVETNFVMATVEGEVSNFAAPSSGHWYFTLKDSGAQLRAVMFRGRNRHAESRPQDGMQVVCSGTVTVYPARGDLQMVVDSLGVAGQGDLQKAFEELKAKLATEGLFAAERKKPLPPFPKSVGVVTSASGAAFRDVLHVMQRRAPNIHVLLCPVKVQGEGAAEEIAQAISDMNDYGNVDLLVIGRGGGSIEDLWAFNEEVVARAIADSAIPIISAVGHETDFTISDLVADMRAPTPSAAAEIVSKNRLELESHLDHLAIRLRSRLSQSLALVSERLSGLERRLNLYRREFAQLPDVVDDLERRLLRAIELSIQRYAERLGTKASQLEALSPLSHLSRGFVIASKEKTGAGLTSSKDLHQGDTLWLRFAQGRARTRVEDVES